MNALIAMRIVRVFSAVAIVVAYSIGLFWLGTNVERKSINSSLAGRNHALLKQDEIANADFKTRQIEIGAAVYETLRLVRECRK